MNHVDNTGKLIFLFSTVLSKTSIQIILDGKQVGYKTDMGPVGNRVTGVICLVADILFVLYFLYHIYRNEISHIRKSLLVTFYLLWGFSIVITVITYFQGMSGYYILLALVPCVGVQVKILYDLNIISKSLETKES